jgi:hypothetical protein
MLLLPPVQVSYGAIGKKIFFFYSASKFKNSENSLFIFEFFLMNF